MRLFHPNRLNKNLLYIALSSVGLTATLVSQQSQAEIYKWRNAQGVVQYADKPPVSGFSKADRHEIVNALQSKDLCAEPTAKTAAAATAKKLDANFFGLGSPNKNIVAMGQPASGGMGGVINAGRPANFTNGIGARPINSRARPSNPVSAPVRGAAPVFGTPQNNAPSFGGLGSGRFFRNGNNIGTLFGKPFKTAGNKPVIGGLPTPKPTPTPAPTPTPTPSPSPVPTPAPNIIQSGLQPAVDISKNMAPAVGASEPFIGKYDPPAPGDGDGQFRTACRVSHMSNDDPIVYPNQQGAAHHHTFFGNTSLNFKSDVANMRNAGTSTCKGGTANLSAYWIPSMIDTATKTPLVPSDAVFYYKTGYTVKREAVTPPPKGLRIIAGNGKSTVSQRIDKYTNHVRYNCVLSNGKEQPESDSIPACAKGSIIHSVVHFPNCWDGKNLDSPDHQSHMAYAKYGEGCPATHPTAIPSITFNIFYAVTQTTGTANWRLASDNYAKSGYNAGYSGHADWVNGWDPNIMKLAVENCDNKGVDCGVGNLGNGTGLWFKKDSEY